MENEAVHIKMKTREQVLARRDAMTPEQRAAASREICEQLKHVVGAALESRKAHEQGQATRQPGGWQRENELGSNRAKHVDERGTDVPCVAVYMPMKSEVDISGFIAWLYRRGARVAFPCMNKKGVTPRMHMREVGHAAWAASLDVQEDRRHAEGRSAETEASKQQSTGAQACGAQSSEAHAPEAQALKTQGREKTTADQRDRETHLAPFIAKPIKRFAEDDPALAEFPIVPPAGIDTIVVPMVAFDDEWQRLGYGGGNYDEYLGLLAPGTLVVGAAFETQRVPHVPTEPHDLPLPTIVSA